MSKRFQKDVQSKAHGVRFFEQFLKNFVRPYGETKEAPEDETILKRLQPFNCELLCRPKIGMSELSASIDDPLRAIMKSKSKLVNVSEVKKLGKGLEELVHGLEGFNRKGWEEGESSKGRKKEVSDGDVKDVLRCFLKEKSGVEKAISEAFVVGSNLMTLATNYLVARALFRNPDEYAEKCKIAGEEGKKFKKEGTVKALKELLQSTCVEKSTLGKKKGKKKDDKKLYLQLESSEEETESDKETESDQQTESESDTDKESDVSETVEEEMKKAKRKQVLEEQDEEQEQEESEEEEDEEEVTVRKQKGKNEKKSKGVVEQGEKDGEQAKEKAKCLKQEQVKERETSTEKKAKRENKRKRVVEEEEEEEQAKAEEEVVEKQKGHSKKKKSKRCQEEEKVVVKKVEKQKKK